MKTAVASPDDEDPRSANEQPMPVVQTPAAPNSRPAEVDAVTGVRLPDGPDSPATIDGSIPSPVSSRGLKTAGRRTITDARRTRAVGVDPAAKVSTLPTSGSPQDGGPSRVAGGPVLPMLDSLLDPALALAADIVDDLERVRIANENRVRQLTRSEVDSDGEERGFGLDPDHPDVLALSVLVDVLRAQEHQATLHLQRKLRKHPLGPWMKGQRGVGEKQGARLLAAIGDPYINSAKGEPRTVSALWAYCGLHVLPAGQGSPDDQRSTASRRQLPADQPVSDIHSPSVGGVQHGDPRTAADTHSSSGVAAKRRKGERANWSTKAKMRAYLIAESCIKQLSADCRDGHDRGDHRPTDDQSHRVAPVCSCSPYRVVYDLRRAHTATTHPDWTDGHSHNDALRVASKAILRDLWRAARDWHLAQGGGR